MAGLKKYLTPKRADPDERPMIFASKEYEDIYFAEYSDRIEVYKRRKNKVKLVETFYKSDG